MTHRSDAVVCASACCPTVSHWSQSQLQGRCVGAGLQRDQRSVLGQRASHTLLGSPYKTDTRWTRHHSRRAAALSVGGLFVSDKDLVHWAVQHERCAKANTQKYFTHVSESELALENESILCTN